MKIHLITTKIGFSFFLLISFANPFAALLAKQSLPADFKLTSTNVAEQIIGVWLSPYKNRKIQFYTQAETNRQGEVVQVYQGKVIWLSTNAIAKIKKDGGNPEDELYHDVFSLSFNRKKQKWKGHVLVGKKPKIPYPCSLYLDKQNKNTLWINIFLLKKKLSRLE